MKLILFFGLISSSVYANINFSKDRSFQTITEQKLENQIEEFWNTQNKLPNKLKVNNVELKLNYNSDEKLTKYVKKLLRRYRSDFASVVIIDNETSKVLTAIDYTKKTKKFGRELTFSATHPAASLFKVITASALVENDFIDSDSKFSYNGKSSTLYKYQLKDRRNRWTRTRNFKKAFAMSNNVIFGKAAIKYLNHNILSSMGEKFGFGDESIFSILPIDESRQMDGESNYELAEFASGFNRGTLMSPYHGAVVASVIAKRGILEKPILLSSVTKADEPSEVLWRDTPVIGRVLERESADEIQKMMEYTVKYGTARSAFRRWRHKDVIVGGKTGSITGGEPFGKRDWFTSYSRNKDGTGGISVCIMITNVKKWYIKSTFLARMIYDYYYKHVAKDS